MANKSELIPYLVRIFYAFDTAAAWDLLENQPNDLGEFLTQKKFKHTDIYNPVVFRSSKKKNINISREIDFEHFIDFDLLDELIPKDESGEYEKTPAELGIKIISELLKEKKLHELSRDSQYFDYPNEIDDYRYHISNLTYYHQLHEYYSEAVANENDKSDTNESVNEKEKELFDKLLSLNSNPTGNSYRYGYSENDTGFYLKEYNLLRWDQAFLGKEYEKTLKEFDLKEFDLKENVLKVSVLVGDYRDLLARQIDRQLKQLNEINEILVDHLSLFYSKVEGSIIDQMPDEDPDSLLQEMHPITKDRLYIFKVMNAIHHTFHLNDNDPGILKYQTDRIVEIPYIDKQTKDHLISDIELYARKKDPILKVARNLALKSSICESLLEDLLMREPIKSFDEFCESIRPELTGEMIDKRVQFHYNNRMTWGNIFDDTRKWLFNTHGLDEESVKNKFDFNISDKDSFERIMRKRIKLRTRNS